MREYLNDTIIPYKGTETFPFGTKIEDIRSKLKKEGISFLQFVEPNKGCAPEIPWIHITVDNSITLCFVQDILFEIVFENEYTGKLANGGYVGMKLKDLLAIDASLEYNDEEEDFSSNSGYWVTDDIDSGEVTSITIFIPEVEEDCFFAYEWVEKYKQQY